jgi:HPt (histidine-containing phosphotransfer) domain-containing protein
MIEPETRSETGNRRRPVLAGERPIDLAHLARQTLGNRELERDVLHLFCKQAERLLTRAEDRDADLGEIAHTLVGSARGIGAFALAGVAERVETASLAGAGDRTALVADLTAATRPAVDFARTLAVCA